MKHEPREEHQIELDHGGSDNQLPYASFENGRPDLNLIVLHRHCRSRQLGADQIDAKFKEQIANPAEFSSSSSN